MASKKVKTDGTVEYPLASPETPETSQPNLAVVPFQTGQDVPLEPGFEQVGLPPIIKPGQIPIGGWLKGTITKVVESTVASIKNPLLYLDVDTGTGQIAKVAFPVVATVASAFGCRPGSVPTPDELSPYIGAGIIIKKVGQAAAKKGQKKGAHLFTVWLKKPEAAAKKRG